MKRGKKYNLIKKQITQKELPLEEALKEVTKLSTSKFKGKIELHANLNVNEKERKNNIRGSVTYSKPVGKAKRVLVFADQSGQEIAKKAGAEYYGLEELIEKVKGGWIDFDIVIASTGAMPKVSVLGRTLGTKGLMPNPKSGTVTDDIKGAVESYKGGKIDFRSDNGVVHTIIGLQDSTEDELKENFTKALNAIIQGSGKPQKVGLKSIFLSPTMGPSVKVRLDSVFKEE